ncbi:MAG TPA: hypothetical protein VJ777_05470 [Mycobacterium sp.]|nr:hypothetical protein [Mycobacterium sp.]
MNAASAVRNRDPGQRVSRLPSVIRGHPLTTSWRSAVPSAALANLVGTVVTRQHPPRISGGHSREPECQILRRYCRVRFRGASFDIGVLNAHAWPTGKREPLRSSSGAAGSAAAGGFLFQANVAAYLATTMLHKLNAPQWLGFPPNTSIASVRCEATTIVDDVVALTSHGGYVYVQAKKTVSVSTEFTSPLGESLIQLAEQFIYGTGARPLDTRDRLVLAMGSDRSTRSLQQSLPNVLRRIRNLQSVQRELVALNQQERRLFDAVMHHLTSVLTTNRILNFIDLFCMSPLEFGDGQNTEVALNILAMRAEPGDAPERTVWDVLVRAFEEAAGNRSGYTAASLARHLRTVGVWQAEVAEQTVERLPVPSTKAKRLQTTRGPVDLSDSEVNIVNHPALQRLRNLSASGLVNLAYPGATGTEFEEAVDGVLVATEIGAALQKCSTSAGPTESETALVRVAHLVRNVSAIPLDSAIRGVLGFDVPGGLRDLERVLRNPLHQPTLAAFLDSLYASAASDAGFASATDAVLTMAGGRLSDHGLNERHALLADLVRGLLVNTIRRDRKAAALGLVGAGATDIRWILRFIEIVPGGEGSRTRLAVGEGALSAVQALAAGLAEWHRMVTNHRVVRAAGAMAERAIGEALNGSEVGHAWDALLSATDQDLFGSLLKVIGIANPVAVQLLQDVRERRLHVTVRDVMPATVRHVGRNAWSRVTLAQQVEATMGLPAGAVAIASAGRQEDLRELVVGGEGRPSQPWLAFLTHLDALDLEPLALVMSRPEVEAMQADGRTGLLRESLAGIIF